MFEGVNLWNHKSEAGNSLVDDIGCFTITQVKPQLVLYKSVTIIEVYKRSLCKSKCLDNI